jgi:hypothetical protein
MSLRALGRSRTARGAAWLLLSLPLGLLYAAMLGGGAALSVATLGIWYGVARLEASGLQLIAMTLVGIPVAIALFVYLGTRILRLTGRAARRCASFERGLARRLLDIDVPEPPGRRTATGREIGHLLLKLPVGVAAYGVMLSVITAAVILLSRPLPTDVVPLMPGTTAHADSLAGSLALVGAGTGVALLLLPVVRWLTAAAVWVVARTLR